MDETTLDKLEKLARLKASGALNDSEFDAAKAAMLREPDARPASAAATPTANTAPPRQAMPINDDDLAPIWRARFAFMDAHGMTTSPAYRTTIRSLPWGERARLAMSFLGFFLGPFYYLYLGIWKPALTILAASAAATLVIDALELPDIVDRGLTFGVFGLYATICIPAFYLKRRYGIHSWNPFATAPRA